MSIQPFAQSLLSDVRKRREEEERRLRKQQERNELLGLVGGLAVKIGNEALANKTSNFLQNEQVWNANQTQKLARKNAASFYNIQSSVDASGGDARSWAAKNMMPEFQARAEEILADEYTGAAGPYQELVRKKVDELADQWATDYEEALQLSSRIASEDDYNSMVVLNAKKARPNDIGSYVSRGIINLFGGRSQDDIRQEAVTAITEGRMANNAEKLNSFMSQYKTTGDLVRAFDFANIVFPEQELSEDERFKINRTQKIANVDDQLIVYEQVDKEEINTGEKTTEINMSEQAKPRVLFKPDSDPEQIRLDAMKGLNTAFNFHKDASTMLRPSAFSKFVAAANADNLNIQAPKTVAEHDEIQQLYRTYLTNPDNLQDPFKNQQTLKIFDLMVGEPEEFMNMLSSALAEDDPNIREQGIQELANSIARKMLLAEDLLRGRVRDYRDLP